MEDDLAAPLPDHSLDL
uniref:Uncharacterized protein n=1 Tax=Arundo donax TaxID=35708 RepID=A0A0A8YCE2_ARUDO